MSYYGITHLQEIAMNTTTYDALGALEATRVAATRSTASPTSGFNYEDAFSRTVGWVTADELQVLRGKRVAIAGAGGAGGVHLITLTRLGIGAFNISDFDSFEVVNFNRQAGAMMSTVGQPKVDVMERMAKDINPELNIRKFPAGVFEHNMDDFLDGVDLYLDALDFFAFEARSAVFAACARKGIPAVTVAPLGLGGALMNFVPGGMTFEQYFGFDGVDDFEKSIRMLVGLAPSAVHTAYLVDPTRIDLAARKGPSTPMGIQFCAAIGATETLKLLLKRGKVYAAPFAITYDGYFNRRIMTWRPGGYRNPLTRLRTALVRRFLKRALEKDQRRAKATN